MHFSHSIVELVFLLSLRYLEALVDENSLRNFVDLTDYHSDITIYEKAVVHPENFHRCKLVLLSPLPGYQVKEIILSKSCHFVISLVLQSDNVSVPRMARAIAGVTLQLSGKACVEDSSNISEEGGNDEGRPLNRGLTWRVFIDGVEEATSGYSLLEISLPGLDIGQHSLESR